MSEPLVSVIVPVYKVEAYLDKCVESLVAQDLREIEIILVDDGSPDNCPALCDAWAQRDERIRVLHKENGGLSSARNAGVAIARAPYVGFVDSDDYVAPNMYSRLLASITAHHAQMAVGGVRGVYANRETTAGNGEQFVMNRTQAFKEFLSGERLRIWVPVKLYEKRLFDHVKFETGRTYEDLLIIADLLEQCEVVSADLEPFYFYMHHEESITTSSYNKRTLDWVYAAEHAREVTRRVCPEALPEAQFRVANCYFGVLDIMLMSNTPVPRSDQDRVVNYLRTHWQEIANSPYTGKARKLALQVLRVSVAAYKQLVKLQNARYRSA